MSMLDDIRQQQKLRAAEGYLDLAIALSDRWHLQPALRNRLAERALDALSEIKDNSRCRGDVDHLVGQALRTMDRFRDAIAPLRRASAAQPENIHIHLAIGWCQKRLGRLDLAIQALEDAMEFAPDEGIIHYNLACYWSLAKNKGLALRYLTQSFDLDPDYRDMVAHERDFDSLRTDPEFQMLTSVIV